MSNFEIRVAIFLAVLFGAYIFGAFILWDFNAGNWGMKSRIFLALFGPAFGFLMAVNPYFPDSD